MSPDSSYYRTPETDISQGDIFGEIPHLHARDKLQIIREAKTKGKHRIFGLYPFPSEPGEEPDAPGRSTTGGPIDLVRGENAAIFCQLSKGILLNHDCDIENERAHRLVAMIYPLARIQDPQHRQAIENNQNYTRLFLPFADHFLDEPSYVDFRRISCIHPDFLIPEN